MLLRCLMCHVVWNVVLWDVQYVTVSLEMSLCSHSLFSVFFKCCCFPEMFSKMFSCFLISCLCFDPQGHRTFSSKVGWHGQYNTFSNIQYYKLHLVRDTYTAFFPISYILFTSAFGSRSVSQYSLIQIQSAVCSLFFGAFARSHFCVMAFFLAAKMLLKEIAVLCQWHSCDPAMFQPTYNAAKEQSTYNPAIFIISVLISCQNEKKEDKPLKIWKWQPSVFNHTASCLCFLPLSDTVC